MADIQRKVVNGVNTVVMHGKNYVEVAERVRLVHDQKREFEVLESAPLSFGDRCIWRVVVKVDGKLYTGNAEVKLNARSGPDATNPFECGETSALGRALAFAGFGSVESIASFDEVYRATNGTTKEPTEKPTKPATPPVQPTQRPTPVPTQETVQPAQSKKAAPVFTKLEDVPNIPQLKAQAEGLKMIWDAVLKTSCGKRYEAVVQSGDDATPEDCATIAAFLNKVAQARAKQNGGDKLPKAS